MEKALRKRVVIVLKDSGEFQRIKILAKRMCIRFFANPGFRFKTKSETYLLPADRAKKFMEACRVFLPKHSVWMKKG